MLFIIALILTSLTPNLSSGAEVKKRLARLEEDVLGLKLMQEDHSKVELSGRFDSIYHYLDVENRSSDIPEENYNYTVSEFVLNLNKVNHRRIKFYSSLGATYFWNNNIQTPDVIVSNGQSDVRGPYPFVQKAFLDYFLFDSKLSLSLGRLPTQYGPPENFSNNRPRQGTYPALLYSLPLDGVAVTFNLKEMFSLNDRHLLRLIYSPFYNHDNLTAPNEAGSSSQFNGLETKNGGALHLNFETERSWNFGDLHFIVQGYYAQFGRPRSLEDVRGVLQSSLSGGNVDRNVYEIGSDDDKLAEMASAIFHMEIKSLFNVDLDLYGSYKWSWYNKKGNLDAVIVEDNMGGSLGSVGSAQDLGGFLFSRDHKASSVLLGLRYNASRRFNLGLEYIRQALGNIPSTVRNMKRLDFYNLVGKGYHSYLNWQVEGMFGIGLGYIYKEEEALFSSFSYSDSQRKTHRSYLQARYSF